LCPCEGSDRGIFNVRCCFNGEKSPRSGETTNLPVDRRTGNRLYITVHHYEYLVGLTHGFCIQKCAQRELGVLLRGGSNDLHATRRSDINVIGLITSGMQCPDQGSCSAPANSQPGSIASHIGQRFFPVVIPDDRSISIQDLKSFSVPKREPRPPGKPCISIWIKEVSEANP